MDEEIPNDNQQQKKHDDIGLDSKLLQIMRELYIFSQMSCKIRIVNYKESFKIVNEQNGKLEQICIVTQKWGEELYDDVYKKIKENKNNYFYQFLEQLIQILQILSENGIIHRELTPQNFRIMFFESNLDLKLISFGVSKQIDITQRNQGTSGVGNINYMAGEVIQGIKYGFDVDVYTVGVLLLGILLGENWQYFNFEYNLQSKDQLLEEMKDNILKAQQNLNENRRYKDWVYELVSQMIEFNSIDKSEQKENQQNKVRINIYQILEMEQFKHLNNNKHGMLYNQQEEEKNNQFKCEY